MRSDAILEAPALISSSDYIASVGRAIERAAVILGRWKLLAIWTSAVRMTRVWAGRLLPHGTIHLRLDEPFRQVQ